MRFFAVASVLFTVFLGVFASPVVKRAPASIAAVLNDLMSVVTPLTDQLNYATPENATQAMLAPVVHDMNVAMTGAVDSMKLLVGQPTNVIMASADGTSILSVSDIANLIFNALDLIVSAVSAVLSMNDSDDYQAFFTPLLQLVVDLLTGVISLVSGLLDALQPLLGAVLSTLNSLGLTGILDQLLGLGFTQG